MKRDDHHNKGLVEEAKLWPADCGDQLLSNAGSETLSIGLFGSGWNQPPAAQEANEKTVVATSPKKLADKPATKNQWAGSPGWARSSQLLVS